MKYAQLAIRMIFTTAFAYFLQNTEQKSHSKADNRDAQEEKHTLSEGVSCVRFSKKPLVESTELESPCKLVNGTRGILMYVESGKLDCSRCCPCHHWSRNEQQCKKCPPSTLDEGCNISPTCYPITYEQNHLKTCEAPPDHHDGISPEHESSTTMPSAVAVNSVSPTPKDSKERTFPAKRIEHPKKGPKELRLLEEPSSYAFVQWKKIPSTQERPITHYEIELKKFESEKPVVNVTESSVTFFNFTSLSPLSCYDVRVRGLNAAGPGPFSDSLEFHTPAEIPPVQGAVVNIVGTLVIIEWELSYMQPPTLAATTFSRKSKESFVNKAASIAGRLNFTLPEKGTYDVHLRYENMHQSGPISRSFTVEFKGKEVDSKEEQGTSDIPWIVAIVTIVVIVVVVRIFCYCYRYRFYSVPSIPCPREEAT